MWREMEKGAAWKKPLSWKKRSLEETVRNHEETREEEYRHVRGRGESKKDTEANLEVSSGVGSGDPQREEFRS